jgi:hypothetical protein
MKRFTPVLLMFLVMVVAVLPLRAAAKSNDVIGIVASVDPQAAPSLRVASNRAEARTIHTDRSTTYVKWVTHQPWQQDTRANKTALLTGGCVDVELKPGTSEIAKTIHISDEPAGSIYDPCKGRR